MSELTEIADQIHNLWKEGFQVGDVNIELLPEESQALLRMADLSERQAVALERISVSLRDRSEPSRRRPDWTQLALAVALLCMGILIGVMIGGA